MGAAGGPHLAQDLIARIAPTGHPTTLYVVIAMKFPSLLPPSPYHQPHAQPEQEQYGGKSMMPPPFGFEQAPHAYFNSIAQEAAAKMQAEEAVKAKEAEARSAEEAAATQANQERQAALAAEQLPDVADGPQWIAFEEGFNKEFASVLHIFGPEAELLSSGPYDKHAKSGEDVPARALMGLFSVAQRDLLLDYFKTHRIPERLFNGSDQGGLDAQQRILLSSHILVNGTYSPGDFDQRVHAKNCGHWVQTVQHYAGVTANNGANTDSINGNFDLFGNVVAGASTERVAGKTDTRVKAGDLDIVEGVESGPIDPQSSHYAKVEQYEEDLARYNEEMKAYEAEQAQNPSKKKGKDDKKPKKPTEPWRSTHLPVDNFDMVKPGDWLYIYNANGSGNHSVIFSRWASGWDEFNPNEKEAPIMSPIEQEEETQTELVKNPEMVKYRRAITFDQGSTDSGGLAHGVNLGNQYYRDKDLQVSPITLVSKVSADARPAVVLDELLPTAKDEGKVEKANDAYIAEVQKKFNVDEAQLIQWMRAENKANLQKLGDRLTQEQREMLTEANEETKDLETLVRLTSRIRQWTQNAAILQRNEEKQYTKENAKYAEVEAVYEALRESTAAKTKPYELEIAECERQIKAIAEKHDLPALKAVIDAKATARNNKKADRNKFEKGSKDYKALHKEYKAIRDEVKELKAEYEPIAAEIDDLMKTIAKKKQKIEKLQKPLWKMAGSLPYGQVALGSKEGENKASQSSASNGKLSNLFDEALIQTYLQDPPGPEMD